ncbi:ORFL183W, partial [Human betaherpesvirus 5]
LLRQRTRKKTSRHMEYIVLIIALEKVETDGVFPDDRAVTEAAVVGALGGVFTQEADGSPVGVE